MLDGSPDIYKDTAERTAATGNAARLASALVPAAARGR